MKTFISAVIFGLFGAFAVWLSMAAHWQTWVMFLAWVGFYVFGATVKKAANTFLLLSLGFILGILISLSGNLLQGLLGGFAVPLAVFALITMQTYVARVKMLSNVPAWYFGLIIFFGNHPRLNFHTIVAIFIPIIAGFILAYLNDLAIRLTVGSDQGAG